MTRFWSILLVLGAGLAMVACVADSAVSYAPEEDPSALPAFEPADGEAVVVQPAEQARYERAPLQDPTPEAAAVPAPTLDDQVRIRRLSDDFFALGTWDELVTESTCAQYPVGFQASVPAAAWAEDGVLTLDVPWFPVISGVVDLGQAPLSGFQEFMEWSTLWTCNVDGHAELYSQAISGDVTESLDAEDGQSCQTTARYIFRFVAPTTF